MLRNWARKTLIGLYVLGLVGSIFTINVVGISWAILYVALLTRSNVVEAFAAQEKWLRSARREIWLADLIIQRHSAARKNGFGQ